MAEGDSIQQNDPALIEWAGRISFDQIPGLLLFLATRWLAESGLRSNAQNNALAESSTEALLTSHQLAEHLSVPESWVRTEERLRRIPSVRLGKYVRFRLREVERTLARNQLRRR